MRIPCPFCGSRDSVEFAYFGDARVRRPDPNAADAPAQFFRAVYIRENPAGLHEELWYHAYGCRSWLRVVRDTCTHEVHGATLAMSEGGP